MMGQARAAWASLNKMYYMDTMDMKDYMKFRALPCLYARAGS